MLKKQYIQILIVALICIAFNWSINSLDEIMSFTGTILKVTSPLILGCAIAFIIDLPLKWIEIKIDCIFSHFGKTASKRLKRGISLPLATIFAVGVITALIFFIVPEVFKTLLLFLNQLPGYIQALEVQLKDVFESLESFDIALPRFDVSSDKILSIVNFITGFASVFLGNTLEITTSLFSALFDLFLAFTFAIYLLIEKEKVKLTFKKSIYAFFPLKYADYLSKVLARTDSAFTNFISGQLTEAGILGVMCFVGMKLCTFSQALLISVIIATTALVPIFGAWIGAILGTFIILLTEPGKAIWFVAFILILQQLETNLIYPKVVGKSVGLPAVLVLASVTVGGNLFGIIGMLTAVPIFAVIHSIFKETVDFFYNKKYPKQQENAKVK